MKLINSNLEFYGNYSSYRAETGTFSQEKVPVLLL